MWRRGVWFSERFFESDLISSNECLDFQNLQIAIDIPRNYLANIQSCLELQVGRGTVVWSKSFESARVFSKKCLFLYLSFQKPENPPFGLLNYRRLLQKWTIFIDNVINWYVFYKSWMYSLLTRYWSFHSNLCKKRAKNTRNIVNLLRHWCKFSQLHFNFFNSLLECCSYVQKLSIWLQQFLDFLVLIFHP